MSGVESKENIIIVNARENNLKNVTVSIPLNKFTCVTGPSGCGKSSLIYDTLYAESQRNFLESMSINLFGQKLMDKPKVDKIINLRPALNVSQVSHNVNPRSTVGTTTDISYFLRTLYALISLSNYNIKVDMNYFSPNNPSSCCTKCNGTGQEYYVDEELLIPDPQKSLSDGGILYYKGTKTSLEYKKLEALCNKFDIDINKNVSELTNFEKDVLLYSNNTTEIEVKYRTPKGRYKTKVFKCKGAFVELNEQLENISIPSVFTNISKYLSKRECSICKGHKLKSEVLAIKICDKNIAEVGELSLENVIKWINIVLEEYSDSLINDQVKQVIYEIRKRINTLIDLKLEYLSLTRTIPTLSGGETQRVRLANQLTCDLSGLIYILDEPCKGLHYMNVDNIIMATKKLINKGNTVISIEHNKKYISEADIVIEMGPGGGPKGGQVVSQGHSLNLNFDIKFKENKKMNKFIEMKAISYHNLKALDAKIPVGSITCISGVSGSGKSSLVEVLSKCCSYNKACYCKEIKNANLIKKVMYVNQSPIGKTPRSTVVSYLGIYDKIRDLFASTLEAKKMNLTASHFSMNVEGGRCEMCQGTGKKKVELTYMPDSYIECPTCHGKRFKENVLSVKYKNFTINDILNMPISEVINIFSEIENISRVLNCMIDIGLGYVSLGQMSMNLSGGESQRIKLAKCLSSKVTGKSMYILDEPTSGLNEKDILLLENVLYKLSDMKETIVIIEHNVEFISHVSDFIIDLGIDAGENGGRTIISGYPKDVFNEYNSSWKQFILSNEKLNK